MSRWHAAGLSTHPDQERPAEDGVLQSGGTLSALCRLADGEGHADGEITQSQSGKIEIEVVVVDFGKPVEVTARYADQPVPLKLASREELWSTWKGTVDTSLAYDGDRVVHVSSRLGDDVSTCDIHYLVLNGRAEPYRADAPAKLTFEVRGVHATETEIFFNDKPLGTVAANTPDKTVLSFDIPSDRLAKVNRVTVRTGAPSGSHPSNWSTKSTPSTTCATYSVRAS